MPAQEMTLLSDFDLHLFNEGRHYRLYEKLGAHPVKVAGVSGTYFAVWAPNANYVSVIGDFNGWNTGSHPLQPRAQSGIWEGFIPGVGQGAVYKFHIGSHNRGYRVDKVDPFGLYSLPPPETGSVIWDLDYAWADQRLDGEAAAEQRPARADDDLRSPPRLLEARARRGPSVADLPRTGRPVAGVPPAHGLLARGVHADHGASVLRLLGLSGRGIFRADEPLRHAAGPDDAH